MTPQEAVRAAREAVDRSEWAAFAKTANARWQAEKQRRAEVLRAAARQKGWQG